MSLFDGWGFQSPYALLALVGLLVPLVIHLLSKSKGELIPFGNIKLIQQTKPTRMREIRLADLLLLICRLLILLFSILLLAQLYQNQAQDSKSKLLISKDWLNNASTDDKTKLLSKMKNSDSYLLSKSFDVLHEKDVLSWDENLANTKDEVNFNSENIWLLVNHFTDSLRQSTSVSVYTTNKYSQFNHNKISIKHEVEWYIKKVAIDESYYDNFNKPLTVTIVFDNDRQIELVHLVKALSLIQQQKISLLTFNQVESTDNLTQVDWIFYLSSKVISKPLITLVNNGAKLVVDRSSIEDHVDNVERRLNYFSKTVPNSFMENLVNYPKGLGRIFALDDKFNHNWSSLLTQIQFPQMLLSLISSDHINAINNQQQRLYNDQILASQPLTSEQLKSINRPFESTLYNSNLFNPKVFKYLVFLLVLFWLIERILSELILKRQAKLK